MADNVPILDATNTSTPIASDDVAGVQFQRVKLDVGGDGASVPFTDPATGAKQDTAAALLTTIRDEALAIDGKLPALSDGRIPVVLPAGGSGLTDAELRATPVPVSGTVTVANPTAQGLTDAQLRASAVPVSLASAPLPTNAATVAGQDAATAILTTIDADTGLLATRTPALGQALMAASRPVAIASDQSPVPSRIASYTYPASAGNSSTAQLAAGATFTGTIETPQDQPSLSILLTSDQPITLTVRQYIDAGGTFQVPSIVFYVAAGAGFARSLTLNGNFFRVDAQNTGASTTTTFRLDCALGTLGDAESTGTTPVTELPLVLTGAAAQTAVVNNILEPTAGASGTAVASFRAASVQVVSTGTGGTFIFEQSNDGTNWIALPVFNAALVTAVPTTAAITASASQIIYTFPVRCNFVRLRIATTITGGSIRAFTRLSTEPWTGAVQLVASNTAANLQATVSGTVTANIGTGSLAAGANAIGDVGLQVRANATGAMTTHHVVSAASTNVAQIKATAGRVFGWYFQNTTASIQYVKLHNVASATAGAAVQQTIGIPANGFSSGTFPMGIAFTTAISRSIVTGSADADATATTAGAVVGDVFFA
jgi:hypothetical protein